MRFTKLGLTAAAVAAIACGGSQRPEPEPPPTAAPTLAPAPPPKPLRFATPPPIRATPAPPVVSSPPPKRTGPRATPPPTPPPVTTPTVDHVRVAALVADAEGKLAEGKLREAGALFDDALALDPDNARARKGKARVATTTLGLTRTLVPDLASSEGAEGKIKQIDGFDDVEELNVKRAVRIPGRAELDATTAHLKPGDSYTVSIFVRNQSKKKKNIKIANVNVHRIVNDKDSVVAVAWSPIEVLPKQRGLVATLSGPWEDAVSSWILSVKLLSENGDIYENRLVWK